MADFPANGRSDAGEVALGILGCGLLLFLIALFGTIIWFLGHGVYTRDLWEVITGVVIFVIASIIGGILRVIRR